MNDANVVVVAEPNNIPDGTTTATAEAQGDDCKEVATTSDYRNNNNNNNNNNELESISHSSPLVEIEEEDRRSLRLYSKKHRVYVFREFILQTYSEYLQSDDVVNNNNRTGSIILDVAGGKGDLSWILHNIDNYQSIVVDPRRTINHIDKSVAYLRRFPDECRKRAIPHQSSYQPIAALMPILAQKEYHMESPSHLRIFVDDELVRAVQAVIHNCSAPNCHDQWEEYWTNATQRTIHFITPSGKNDFSLERVDMSDNTMTDAPTALQHIMHAKLIVGYHPDQATDACFQLGQLLNIPVCVVPCCVFPSEFPHRRFYVDTGSIHATTTGNKEEDEEADDDDTFANSSQPVEKYDDLIQYLMQMYPNVKMDTLAFPGTTTARRIVLYTLPDEY